MALPFSNGKPRKRDQIVAIDLGGRITKAVLMQRRNETLTLLRYAFLDAPVQKSFAVDTLTDHLKSAVEALDTKNRQVSLAVGVTDCVVRQAEMPQMPLPDMRQILKINPKSYLQQDLPNHIFDCYIFPPRMSSHPDDKAKQLNSLSQKLRVLVAGAKKQLIDDLQSATKNAGLIAESFIPGLIGPLNAFEVAMPDIFAKGTFALVDVGFKNTSITLIQDGELILSRVVGIGSDKLTAGLAESMSIGYAEAEGIKIGMPTEVQPALEALVAPLGRELRASIDFFEHQQEKHVSNVYISGGAARSEFIVKILESELMMPCRPWSPVSTIQLALPPQQTAELEQVAPQLTVAIGAAIAAF